MKAFSAIVILSLFAASWAFNAVRPLPSTAIDTSFLTKVGTKKKNSFAQLTTMMKELRDVSQVTDFLNGQLEGIEENRQEKLAIVQSDRAAFAEEEEFRNREIQEGQEGGAAASAALDQCTSQRAIAADRNERAAAALVKFQEKLERLIADREAQHALNEKHVDLLDDFQNKLATLNELLDDYEASGSSPASDVQFIQTTNKLLKHGLRSGQSKLITGLYNKLIQMHTKQQVNEEDLSEIRDLVTQMANTAAQQVVDINNQDAEQQAVFEQTQSAIQDVLSVLNAQVAKTAAFLVVADQCIAQETSILALSEDKVTRNQDLLAVAQALIAAVEEQWSVSEASRRREVSVINALLTAIRSLEELFEDFVGPQVGDLINLKML